MRRSRRNIDYTNHPDMRYAMAFKRVKRIKGFYMHLMVYVIFNTIIILANKGNATTAEFWKWDTFSLPVFWGVGLVAHAASVFGRDLFFGKNWEERKIRQFMEHEQNKNWE